MTVLDADVASPVWIVGPVTWDRFGAEQVPGGAVSYAARTAAAFGQRAYVLTIAGSDADLSALAGHAVAAIPARHTLTYEHRLEGGRRRMRLLARPERALHARDVPPEWPHPRRLILGPLLPDDVDVASFLDAYTAEETALLAQGLQRVIVADGAVEHAGCPSAALADAARPAVSLFLSAEETAAWPAPALDALVARARRLVRTFGAQGAEVRAGTAVATIPAAPARVVDSTGAGDVFATAFILAVSAGEQVAGRLAAACAAASVERRGPAALPSLAAIAARPAARGDAP